ncbi:hypothetical protein FZI91_17090 [Mycobacterium sp. CBMA271]|uniref:hypothetical protein n=1 Tax=unclassified Mycobacteroides TaxID=2618759 RepID=UPI0012DEF5E8|nr:MULTISPECIES: hypothetical protein [unclassified Mycobacteroides]MUM18115.1 hypothetical protein [Mycobacteroides sp. CBMA 326]MUM23400.1 hypothetical protein [Mycobacteroides sp. CBMA 271]
MWGARFGSVALAAAVMLTCGCDVRVEGEATLPAPDLCAALPAEVVQTIYGQTNSPLFVSKRVDDDPFHAGGMASCHYGGPSALGGISLGIPLGKPVKDIAELVGGTYDATGADIRIDTDKAYVLLNGPTKAIAVQHGETQFVISWDSLMWAEKKTITKEQLIALATEVVKNLPRNYVTPPREIPAECPDAATMAVVGPVTNARGTAAKEALYCDYAGRDGIIQMSAVREDSDLIERRIEHLRGPSESDVVAPPIAPDAALTAFGTTQLRSEGFLSKCCSIRITSHVPGTTKRTGGLSPLERAATTNFIDAARRWAGSK